MANPYYITSGVTGRTYDVFSIIKIMNIKQAAFYSSKGLPIEDIEISTDRKTGDPIYCFYFNREKTKDVFEEWCKRKEVVES